MGGCRSGAHALEVGLLYRLLNGLASVASLGHELGEAVGLFTSAAERLSNLSLTPVIVFDRLRQQQPQAFRAIPVLARGEHVLEHAPHIGTQVLIDESLVQDAESVAKCGRSLT